MAKHKISPAVHKDLVATANSLPKFQKQNDKGELIYHLVVRSIKGCDLTKQQKEIVLKEYGRISPTARYKLQFREPALIDHVANIVKVYKEEGRAGADVYAEFWREEYKKAQEQMNNIKSLIEKASDVAEGAPGLKVLPINE